MATTRTSTQVGPTRPHSGLVQLAGSVTVTPVFPPRAIVTAFEKAVNDEISQCFKLQPPLLQQKQYPGNWETAESNFHGGPQYRVSLQVKNVSSCAVGTTMQIQVTPKDRVILLEPPPQEDPDGLNQVLNPLPKDYGGQYPASPPFDIAPGQVSPVHHVYFSTISGDNVEAPYLEVKIVGTPELLGQSSQILEYAFE